MIDPAAPIQRAVYAALSAPGALPVIGRAAVKVYDRVPPDAVFPYVVLGEDQVLDDSADAYEGDYVVVNVHVWSRAGGHMEAKTLAGAVRIALSQELDASGDGVRVVTWLYERTRYLDDADGVTVQAIVTVKYGVEPLA